MTLSFFVPGEPKAQPRPRAFSRGGHTRMYDPGTAKGWKAAVACAARDAAKREWGQGRLMDAALRLDCWISFLRPKSHFRTNGQLKPSAPQRHTQRPDMENVLKGIADAITDAGVWRDDCLIVQQMSHKDWCESQAEQGALITIETI